MIKLLVYFTAIGKAQKYIPHMLCIKKLRSNTISNMLMISEGF